MESSLIALVVAGVSLLCALLALWRSPRSQTYDLLVRVADLERHVASWSTAATREQRRVLAQDARDAKQRKAARQEDLLEESLAAIRASEQPAPTDQPAQPATTREDQMRALRERAARFGLLPH